MAMRAEFSVKLKREALKYKVKIDAQVLEGKLGSAYAAVRMLGAGPNDASKKTFEINSFVDKVYSNQQCADLLADHFSIISQEFDPLISTYFPQRLWMNS